MKNISVDFFSVVNDGKLQNLLKQQNRQSRDTSTSLYEDPKKQIVNDLYEKIQTVLSNNEESPSTKLNTLKHLKHNFSANFETSHTDPISEKSDRYQIFLMSVTWPTDQIWVFLNIKYAIA